MSCVGLSCDLLSCDLLSCVVSCAYVYAYVYVVCVSMCTLRIHVFIITVRAVGGVGPRAGATSMRAIEKECSIVKQQKHNIASCLYRMLTFSLKTCQIRCLTSPGMLYKNNACIIQQELKYSIMSRHNTHF